MSQEESLTDVSIRERQLEAHILRSESYLKRADRDLKRQVSMIYLAIALILLFQGIFTLRTQNWASTDHLLLTCFTSLLAIINCCLLMHTKQSLRRLNEAWLKPEEKLALESLKSQRRDILMAVVRSATANDSAELN